MERICVTGGAGFIGSHVVRHLALRYPRAEIIVVDKLSYVSRLEYIDSLLSSGRVTLKRASICDTDAMREALAGTDVVIHAAAESHVDNSYRDLSPFVENNVCGTISMLQAAVDARVGLFLHVSTDEVYGDSATRAFDVGDALNPTNPYSASKAGAEMFVRSFEQSHDLPVRITRANNIYGVHQYPEKLIPKAISHGLLGRRFPVHGDGSSIRSFLHVEDFCTALTAILETGEDSAVYNIPSQHEYSVLDIIELVCSQLGIALPDFIDFVPDRPHNDCRYSMNGKLLRGLGWQADRRLEQDLPGLVEWYRKNLHMYFGHTKAADLLKKAARPKTRARGRVPDAQFVRTIPS